MRVTAFLLLALLTVAIRPAAAEWQVLTDEELDEISAGGVQLDLNVNPQDQTVSFNFGMGPTFGSGDVTVSPAQQATTAPPTFVFNGANLASSTFFVNNMVFNLNICVMCRANSIIQQGIGVPVTITSP